MKKYPFIIPILFLIFISSAGAAGELMQDKTVISKAVVLEAVQMPDRTIDGNVRGEFQILKAEILEGPEKGLIVEVEDDYIHLEKGEKFFLQKTETTDGMVFYNVADADRLPYLLFFAVLFAAVIIYFGRMQGFRALLSLAGSFLIIFYLFIPNILGGANPIVLSAVISVLIVTLAIYLTHGVSRDSSAALLSSIITVMGAFALSYIAVRLTKLTGFAADESMYLNFGTGGVLDFRGLLLGSMIIGALGALDDIAVTQVFAVRELSDHAKHLSKKEIFARGLRIGREHIGAIVNTLALAYLSVAMPLLLLLSATNNSDLPLYLIINKEIFATEIIRTVVGSVALVLAVPISTWLAVNFANNKSSV